ncbi:MAG: hypothetical protein IPN87_11290 [Saprospiraceae bacterium]|nr:hypothetical protein [Candidatus Brachybacter algidus]
MRLQSEIEYSRKEIFDSAYKLLSADVNADNAVSVRDPIEIRKLILGKTDKFSYLMNHGDLLISVPFP